MDYISHPVPKYYKIYEDLLHQIRNGKYQADDLFPSDTELVKRYDVSRGTVREAIKLLFRQGYLVREQGKGTFVTYKKIRQNAERLTGFTELMKQHNLKPSARLLEKELMNPPANISHIMQLSPEEKLVRIVRLRLGDNQPLIIERSYFTWSLFEPIFSMDLEANSIFELLHTCTTTRLEDACQCIEAVSAGPQEHRLLGVEPGTPLLLIKRLIQTAEGEYFQYSEDVYRSDRIHFSTKTLPYQAGQDAPQLPFALTEQDVF